MTVKAGTRCTYPDCGGVYGRWGFDEEVVCSLCGRNGQEPIIAQSPEFKANLRAQAERALAGIDWSDSAKNGRPRKDRSA